MFWDFEIVGNDFQTAPKQLLAIVVGELFGKFLHRGVINARGVKPDVFKVGAATHAPSRHTRARETFSIWSYTCNYPSTADGIKHSSDIKIIGVR